MDNIRICDNSFTSSSNNTVHNQAPWNRVAGGFNPTFFKSGKIVSQRYEMSSSLIDSANVPVAKDNRHLNCERFVELEQSKAVSKLRVFQNLFYFLQQFFKYSRGLLHLILYWEFVTTNVGRT